MLFVLSVARRALECRVQRSSRWHRRCSGRDYLRAVPGLHEALFGTVMVVSYEWWIVPKGHHCTMRVNSTISLCATFITRMWTSPHYTQTWQQNARCAFQCQQFRGFLFFRFFQCERVMSTTNLLRFALHCVCRIYHIHFWVTCYPKSTDRFSVSCFAMCTFWKTCHPDLVTRSFACRRTHVMTAVLWCAFSLSFFSFSFLVESEIFKVSKVKHTCCKGRHPLQWNRTRVPVYSTSGGHRFIY